MVKLLHSDRGTPYIDMGEFGSLIFSKMTAHPTKGYKWLTYSRRYNETFEIKKTVDGEIVRDVYKVPAHDSCAFTFQLKKNYKGDEGVPRGTIPPRLANFFRKIFDSLTDDEGYFPYENIETLGNIFESTNFKKVMKTPIKRKKRKKKK